MEVNAKLVGIRIMQKRKEYGYSQEKLAELIDISKNHLSSIECGHNLPTIKVSTKICNVLGEDPNYYILGEIPKDDIETYDNTLLKLSPQERKFVNDFLNYLIEKKRNS